MLRDHRPLLVTFADKVAVRDYVAARIGERYLPHSFAILDDPERLAELELPDAYVLKPSHGSGAVIVVSPDAPVAETLPRPEWSWVYRHIRASAADQAQLVAIGRHWLGQLYGQGPNKEWAYGPIPRRILVEELLSGADGGIPDDYKLFVFHGRVHFIQVDAGRFGRRTQDFYRPDWEHLSLSGGPPWAAPRARPGRLEEMIAIAERLAAETDFVRVDLYHLAERVVFGELTSYPAGGDSPFHPERWNAEFGRPWTVPARY
ncbi:hypothetical protein HQQ81_01880 [Microbacteriaceae bacterium VKM Ac-2854]|nr:hypothetical protein [Microbacteriaceae bacterium VKM Ac-2854]